MNTLDHSVLGLPFIWAGVSLSGNPIAAPAKFQVQALESPVALQVGRAQFTWIGHAEWALFALIVLGLLVKLKLSSFPLVIALVVFVTQQAWMQPLLEARTDIIVAGGDAGQSHLHIYFVLAEVLKFGALLWAGYLALSAVLTATEQSSGTNSGPRKT